MVGMDDEVGLCEPACACSKCSIGCSWAQKDLAGQCDWLQCLSWPSSCSTRAPVQGVGTMSATPDCGVSCSTPRRCEGSTPLLFLVLGAGTSWYWARGVLLVRQCLRLAAVGFAQLNGVVSQYNSAPPGKPQKKVASCDATDSSRPYQGGDSFCHWYYTHDLAWCQQTGVSRAHCSMCSAELARCRSLSQCVSL
jgi:hypothetical protein